MVVLVRCCNGTYSLALESRLDELVKEGLVEAVLRDDEWLPVRHSVIRREETVEKGVRNRIPMVYAAV